MKIIVKTCTHGTSELSMNVLAGIAGRLLGPLFLPPHLTGAVNNFL